ncbi:aminoglycoside phosphotransferase family protein [Halobacillus faecis]
MNDGQYDLPFKRLCFNACLGEIVGPAEQIAGGLLHKMYLLETTKGKYAVKVLNPEIMKRPEAMMNYMNSERIANLASNHIPALPANIINGKSVHEINNQYYMVFEWMDGRILKPIDIRKVHSKRMGSILADIHNINFKDLDIAFDGLSNGPLIKWDDYLKKGLQASAEWAGLLNDNKDKLYEWESKSRKAAEVLSSDMVISHRDLDAKNVMWDQDSPVVIDWESAGYINPMQDLIETAIYWSYDGLGNINEERFMAFIKGYKKKYGVLQADWTRVLETGYSGKLGWLEYNLKRSLKMECSDEEEQKLGSAQVTETLLELRQYENSIPILLDLLNNKVGVI